ncbi:MAG: methyltransferase domain-containing protein [Actinobacteria bacterium]|nr:methyltransferase domain-containing protein [Actinomycetota bacterium]MBV8480316.1 methyltransferase domain-containing protein [Actinomycetota bacterium]
METSLLELLRCPLCHARIDAEDGSLSCSGCGRGFGVEHGIPLMLHEDLPGAREKLGETGGWVEKAQAEGWYEPNDEVDAVLPFVNRALGWNDLGWLANGHSFQVLLDRYVGEQRGMRVLEVGAAKAWAAPYWLERDCEFVATDILVDDKIGLGRGAFYGDFGRVQADGEHLPFPDASFDVVYCLATLHHALDLRQMVREMSRVARSGAIVAGLNEGTRGVGRSPENPDQAAEKEVGINEHVHTVWAYFDAFTRAGLRVRRLERPDGWAPSPYGRMLSKIPKIGLSLGTMVHLSAVHYCGVSIYARKPA